MLGWQLLLREWKHNVLLGQSGLLSGSVWHDPCSSLGLVDHNKPDDNSIHYDDSYINSLNDNHFKQRRRYWSRVCTRRGQSRQSHRTSLCNMAVSAEEIK